MCHVQWKCCDMTHFICAYRIDDDKQNRMTSPKKPIDIFCKRYVELLVLKQNVLPNYFDMVRKDMTFVKKNKECSGMWLRGQYVPPICREISTWLYMTSRHGYHRENLKYVDASYVVSEPLFFTSITFLYPNPRSRCTVVVERTVEVPISLEHQ